MFIEKINIHFLKCTRCVPLYKQIPESAFKNKIFNLNDFCFWNVIIECKVNKATRINNANICKFMCVCEFHVKSKKKIE